MFKVLIVGDVILDHYLLGNCSRISPEAPVPVVAINKEEWRLGGAANVANNLVALKAECTLIGVYGSDDPADRIDQLLEESRFINNRLFRCKNRPTTVKSRVLVQGHQMIRLDWERSSWLDNEEEKVVIETIYEEADRADIILISDYRKGVLSENVLNKLFNAAQALGKPTIVDPKSADFSRYKGVSFIKPNRKEAELATGMSICDSASLEKASKIIKEITDAEAVITTLSEDGVGVYTDDHLYTIPTKAQQVFDVTGAGDTYLASFAYEYMRTRNIISACEFANLAAGVVVGKIGSSTVSPEEIDQFKSEYSFYES